MIHFINYPTTIKTFLYRKHPFRLFYHNGIIVTPFLLQLLGNYMLTSEQTKLRFKILIILSSIAVACIIASAVVIFIAQLYGFSVASPFNCTITYFKTKFTSQNAFLTASLITAIIASVAGIAFLIALIVLLVKLGKMEEENINKTADDQISMLYIFLSVGMMATVVPLGYFGSIIIQVTKQCNTSTATDWLIIVATAALAEILFIVCWAILLDMRIKLQEGQAVMDKKSEKKESVKQEKVQKDIQGELIVKVNDQTEPLLDKGQGEQKHIASETQNQKKAHQQQPRKSRFLIPEPEPTISKKPSSSKFSQSSKISQKSHNEKQRQQAKPIPQSNKESKEQSKPETPTQNVTHINFNFPSNFPHVGQPQISPIVINTPMNSSKSSNSLRGKSSKKQKNENRSIIKQSMEEQLSSDSDDRYYKRARKNKKRRFNYEEDEKEERLNKKLKQYERQSDYERQFDRIPSRFQGSPSQPRYVVLSPESLKTFYEFVKHQGQSLKKGRDFATPDLSSGQRHRNPLKEGKVSPSSDEKTPQRIKEYVKRVESPAEPYYTSMVKEFGQELLQPETLKRQQVRQASFYQRLNGHEDSQGDMKRYQRFFKSSRQLHMKQTGSEKNSSLDEYFNLLNSRAEARQSPTTPNPNDANYHTQNYNSLSNYSSVLNEQKGKIPTQRQHRSIRKIKVEKNMNEPPSKRKSIIEQIRNKYN